MRLKGACVLAMAGFVMVSCATPPEPTPDPVEPAPVAPQKPAPPPSISWESRLMEATWESVALSKSKSTVWHVLDISEGDKALAVSTFGQGLYVSQDGGKKWRNFDKPKRPSRSKGDDPKEPGKQIPSNYLSGVDVVWPFMWARSVGHGFGVMNLRDRTWSWWSSKQLDKEYLFPTDISLDEQGGVTISTTDGLWRSANRGKNFDKIGPAQGLPSEYVLSYARQADGGEWMGLLIGLHHKPASGPARTITTADGLPDNKVQGVHLNGDQVWARTDAGVAFSLDGGKQWRVIDQKRGLPSDHVQDLAFQGDVVWAATSRGLAALDPKKAEVTAVYLNGADPSQNMVNAVRIDSQGRLLAGTSRGLFIVAPTNKATAPPAASVCEPDSTLRDPDRALWPRPVSNQFNHLIDQTYQYGQTWGGQFGVHKGVEFNNAEGTQVLAVATGEVTYAEFSKRGTGVVTVRHDERHGGKVIYSLYLHLSGFLVKPGERVEPGKPIGLVGHTGPATNDHLHFEVRMSDKPGDGMEGAPAINPTPFLQPLTGRGMIAGRVRKGGKRVSGARVYGPVIPEPQETPFGFYEAYGKNSESDPTLGEDFAIIDVPPGVYPVEVIFKNEVKTRCVQVEAGKIAWVDVDF